MTLIESIINDVIYLAVLIGFVLIVIAGFRGEKPKEAGEKILEWLKNLFKGDEEE